MTVYTPVTRVGWRAAYNEKKKEKKRKNGKKGGLGVGSVVFLFSGIAYIYH